LPVLASLKSASPSSKLLLVAAVVATAGAVVVIVVYGAGSLIPGLVGGFVASLLAFVLALSFERDQELRRLKRGAEEQQDERTTEVRRRLESIRAELEKNAESLRDLKIDPKSIEVPEFVFVNPQLFWGAWTANAPRLSELLADYELVADLATTYDRLEELRWRLRYRTESRSKELDKTTAPLVDELRKEVDDLIERVRREVGKPNVLPLWWREFLRSRSLIVGDPPWKLTSK
jgi:hypothetical protein